MMRNDYFDEWLISIGVKNRCDKCDGVPENRRGFINNELDNNTGDTPCEVDKCDACDKNLDKESPVTPVTQSIHLMCDDDASVEATVGKGYNDLSHLLHLSHQEKHLSAKELKEIFDEFRLWGRVKCKYCDNLNFKGICVVDSVKGYRPESNKWRRCKSYFEQEVIENQKVFVSKSQ